MNANLTWDIGGAAIAVPSSWQAFLGLFERERTPKPQFHKGDIGEVKRDILEVLAATPAITVKEVRSKLGHKYSVSRINSGLSQLHSTGRASRKRDKPGGYYHYSVRCEA